MTDLGELTGPAGHRPRSWRNRGRMPENRRARLASLGERLALPDAAAAAAWTPEVLDIGFGYGESLLAAVAQYPGRRVLGIEVHQPGLLRAMDALVAAGHVDDVRVLYADATAVLPVLAPGSLAAVRAYFPDPWPKRRHEARRLLGTEVVAGLAGLLAPGGTLHLVTDDPGYAAGMRAAGAAAAGLIPLPAGLGVPDTKYARRAAAAGRAAVDLAWRRTPCEPGP